MDCQVKSLGEQRLKHCSKFFDGTWRIAFGLCRYIEAACRGIERTSVLANTAPGPCRAAINFPGF
jgi:hypothetical protein